MTLRPGLKADNRPLVSRSRDLLWARVDCSEPTTQRAIDCFREID